MGMLNGQSLQGWQPQSLLGPVVIPQIPGAFGNNPMAIQPHAAPVTPKWLSSLTGAAQAIGNALTAPHNALFDPQYGAPQIDPQTGQAQPVGMRPMVDAGTLAGMMTLGAGAMPAEAGALNMGMQAYHGSPHSFDGFSNDAIGTGEGGQVYGHGHYFAENEDTANSYRLGLTANQDSPVLYKGVDIATMKPSGDPEIQAARIVGMATQGNPRDLAKVIADMQTRSFITPATKDAISKLNPADFNVAKRGSMYHVDINADPNQMLDWDKPLAQQPQAVQDVLKPLADEGVKHGVATGYSTAGEAYQAASGISGYHVTQALMDAGVPGIQYLDAGSRAAGTGTRNFVVFDPKNIDILKKYGIAAPVAGGAVAAGMQQAPQAPPLPQSRTLSQ